MSLLLVLAACVKDDTTLATGAITELYVEEGSIKEQYDIDRNEVLEIRPVVRQTNREKPVSYSWEIGSTVYSTDPVFHYVGKELGSFLCRLVLENEDGRSFYEFTLNVNSPYEEGITVISVDPEGKSRLSFMLRQRTEGVADHFEEGDCFATNNPDFELERNVSDVAQCDGTLLLACKGNAAEGRPGTIYFLNEKTLVVQNEVKVPEYPDFRPIRMIQPLRATAGTSYPILCENGKVYEFATGEGAVGESQRYKSEYARGIELYDNASVTYNHIYMWDRLVGALTILYNGYGPYYCSTEYHLSYESIKGEGAGKNFFAGVDFVSMFMPRDPAANASRGDRLMVVGKNAGGMYVKVRLDPGFWYQDEETLQPVLGSFGGLKLCGFASDLTDASPYVATAYYKTLLYGVGNAVKKWNYDTVEMLQAVQTLATVGTDQAVITAMELSLDHKETFVAFYEPQEEGLNGHVWVIDTDSGELLRKYDNVCYRPVKIMYKRK